MSRSPLWNFTLLKKISTGYLRFSASYSKNDPKKNHFSIEHMWWGLTDLVASGCRSMDSIIFYSHATFRTCDRCHIVKIQASTTNKLTISANDFCFTRDYELCRVTCLARVGNQHATEINSGYLVCKLMHINKVHWYNHDKFAQLITFERVNIPGSYLVGRRG